MDSTRLAQIRKDFYLATRQRVEAIVGRESTQLASYRQKYERELSRLKCESVPKRPLMNRIKEAGIVLVGDFHAQKQSARGLLRLLRKVPGNFILRVECLTDEDQIYIDQFLQGRL